MSRFNAALETLRLARQVADYANKLGVSHAASSRDRYVLDHLGAALADCVLQAGLNYSTVVRGRVERILSLYPEAETLDGTLTVLKHHTVADFLLWSHSEKIERFTNLVRLLKTHRVNDTSGLLSWLKRDECRGRLLMIRGVGPKTVDYLACLVGMDCVAVDRHVKKFVNDAGVKANGYDELRIVVSYAADLLEIPRRVFDAWIWQITSQSLRNDVRTQRALEPAIRRMAELPASSRQPVGQRSRDT